MRELFRAACFAAICASQAALAQAKGVASAMKTWSFGGDGISVDVTPLGPDPTQAFLIGRGIASDRAREYASRCAVRIIVRHAEGRREPITYDLRDWRIRPDDGGTRPLKTREDWMEAWKASPPDAAARIGFELSQLPTRQALAAGDSAQGMNAMGLAPGSRFDLLIHWTASGKKHDGSLDKIRCSTP